MIFHVFSYISKYYHEKWLANLLKNGANQNCRSNYSSWSLSFIFYNSKYNQSERRFRNHIFENILHPMTIQSDVADMARAGATTGHYQKNWRFFLYKLGRNFLKRFEYVCVLQQRNRAARCQFAIHDAVPNFHKIIKMSWDNRDRPMPFEMLLLAA